jgi:hypothetical protein
VGEGPGERVPRRIMGIPQQIALSLTRKRERGLV